MHGHIMSLGLNNLYTFRMKSIFQKNEFNKKKMNDRITPQNVRATFYCLQMVSKQSIPSLLNRINACVNCN